MRRRQGRSFCNTPAYAILDRFWKKPPAKSSDDHRLWLTEPAGLEGRCGSTPPYSGMSGTDQPLRRLATWPSSVLVLDGGKAEDEARDLPAQLAALFGSPTNPAYGRLWWLNGSAYTLRPANA